MLKSAVHKNTNETNYSFETPMMVQYLKIKEQHPGCLIFFRLGDFYEMFLDDAKIGAEVLDITLTARSRGKDGDIPMAGVPYHAVEPYLAKLVRAGYKVAICEQLTEPNAGELVERDVVRIVTPGTLLDEKALDRKQNNYIVGIDLAEDTLAFAAVDLSTGDFQVTQVHTDNIENSLSNEIAKFYPSEAILPEKIYNDPKILRVLKSVDGISIFPFSEWHTHSREAQPNLKSHFKVKTLSAFDLDDKYLVQGVSSALLGYLKYTQKDKVNQLKKINYYHPDQHVVLDRSTITNLELFSTIRDHSKRGTLLSVLDQTATSMGARMLRNTIVKPLTEVSEIEKRLDSVSELISNRELRHRVRDLMREITDVERLLSRLAATLGGPKDLVSLSFSLQKFLDIKTEIIDGGIKADLTNSLVATFNQELKEVINLIDSTIVQDPPFNPKEGGLVQSGINKRLDELRGLIQKSKQWVNQLETSEKARTGIGSLKVRFNKVFGYYIEISKSNISLAPDDYIRKQTLVNAERYITEDLKKHEEIILTADEELNRIEYEIFVDTVEKVLNKIEILQNASHALAQLDVLLTFATVSESYKYNRPIFIDSGEISITDGRHPVVETLLESAAFVPNDLLLDHVNQQLLILTGPNMAGKSVYLRQNALIVLMAQLGCFVPASKAVISPVDRIFVRSGASDVIASGLSTFMVEMVETAYILNNATQKSLIIMDEIGRGTSTYDGISIAWSVAEYLVSNIKAKSLFATHYHELQSLEDKFPLIKNYQVAVKENSGELIFLHKVIAGGASHSHGVAVASLAGIPEEVTKSAVGILSELEHSRLNSADFSNISDNSKKRKVNDSTPVRDITKLPKNVAGVISKLKEINTEVITPLEALNILSKLKESAKDE